VRLPRVGGQQRHERVAHALELQLGLRVEEGQGGEIHRRARVLGVEDDSLRGGLRAAVIADADAAEQVLGVLEIGLLLGAAQALAARALVLLVGRGVAVLLQQQLLGGDALGDALRLVLLVRGSLGVSLGLLRGGGGGLLALDLGVLGGVP
jgi:hypothetical protein